MMTVALDVTAARAEVVFASGLQASDKPTAEQVRGTIASLATARGSRWCAGEVAREFGDHPDTAVPRMVWARQTVLEIFPKRGAR